jgi:uncharacterized protein
MKFIWDINKANENIINHAGVTFEEAEQVFDDDNAVEFFDDLHSNEEERFRRVGLSKKRLLFLIYTIREKNGIELIRIISARKANSSEIEIYNEYNQ